MNLVGVKAAMNVKSNLIKRANVIVHGLSQAVKVLGELRQQDAHRVIVHQVIALHQAVVLLADSAKKIMGMAIIMASPSSTKAAY